MNLSVFHCHNATAPRVKVSIVGSLRDREVACSASDRQGSNFESCVWRTVSSQSSHHPQEVLLAQFSLYVHKGGLKPDSFQYNATALFNSVIQQRYSSSPRHPVNNLKFKIILTLMLPIFSDYFSFIWSWIANAISSSKCRKIFFMNKYTSSKCNY